MGNPLFTSVKRQKPKGNKFNLSEEMKLSCNFGQIVPILCKETLPGDYWKINTELLIKFAPLIAPVMHRIKAKVDYFYVPNFQLTEVFEKFINPKVNTVVNPITMPYFTPKSVWDQFKTTSTNPFAVGSLADFLGLPITQTNWYQNSQRHITPLPFVAYQHIYNCYFRDRNAEPLPDEGGASIESNDLFDVNFFKDLKYGKEWNQNSLPYYQMFALFKLRTSCWSPDYFTKALPSPQAGDDVMLPISSTVSLESDGGPLRFTGGTPDLILNNLILGGDEEEEDTYNILVDDPDEDRRELSYESGIKATSQNAGISINDLRKLFSLQSFKEIVERGGDRYPELLQNIWSIFAPDIYFDRPKYLGGAVQPINIGEVVQTSASSDDSAQGNRSGIANSYGRTKTVRCFTRFHGYIIGVLRIMPEATYSQGLERMWTRNSLFDYAFPQFAHLGEQEIRNEEIFANGDQYDEQTFGYTPRYAEYKDGHCHIAGEFRTTLDYWHFGRVFANRPQLNSTFLKMDTMDYDPFNITDDETEHCYVDLYNNVHCRRLLPFFGTPSKL